MAGKFGLEVFPPFLSAGIRFIFGVVTIWCWCSYRRIRLWPQKHEWQPLIQIALLFTLQIGLMNIGFDNTTGSSAAILISTNPLFAAVFAHYLIGSDKLDVFRSAGLLLAFAGVALMLYFSSTPTGADALSSANPVGAGFFFGNSGDWLCLASAAVLGYRLIGSAIVMQQVDSYRLAFWQMLFSIPIFFLLGGVLESVVWSDFSWTAVFGLAYQGVIVAGVGFMVSLWLISRYRPSLMTSFGFIAPVSGVLLSILLLGESFSLAVALSMVLVAAGITLLTIKSVATQ